MITCMEWYGSVMDYNPGNENTNKKIRKWSTWFFSNCDQCRICRINQIMSHWKTEPPWGEVCKKRVKEDILGEKKGDILLFFAASRRSGSAKK